MKKRLLATLLTLCMVLALLPAAALAADGDLIQLDTPTDLSWGKEYDSGGNYEEIPGMMACKLGKSTQNVIEYKIYKTGGQEDELCDSGHWHLGAIDAEINWFNCPNFIWASEEMGSGTYYFTLQALGDGTTYSNSEIATSPTWIYSAPASRLAAPSDLAWSWPCATWKDNAENTGYDLRFFYAETSDDEPREIGATDTLSPYRSEGGDEIFDEYVQANGVGYYYFKVRALSRDITTYQHSEWSNLSTSHYASGAEVKAQLDAITSTSSNDIRAAVQEIGASDLKTAMLLDANGTVGVAQALSDLENKVGGGATVTVTDAMTAFDQEKISVVGANLNTVTGDGAALVIDLPKQNDVIPEIYNNTVAVSFSMELQGVTYEDELDVPVEITLPVPSTIDPDFLVILHYDLAGGCEEILPYLYQQDGQYYAKFVLTHFSDFVMTEKNASSSETETPATPTDPTEPDTPTTPTNPGAVDSPSGPAAASGAYALIFSGAELRTVNVKAGQTVDLSQYVPTKAGYTFDGWYLDKNLTQPVSSVVMDETRTVYAKWVKNGDEPGQPDQPDTPADSTLVSFTDVKDGDWYAGSVSYVVDKGLFNGTSEKEFSPNATMTRAMLMTVLARLDGQDTTPAEGQDWYAPGMDWAMGAGISDGSNPGGAITREQLATMLYRYAGQPETAGTLDGFTDAGKVSDYAETAMKWAVENGIVNGKGDGVLDPGGNATRAEVATMLTRYCEKLGK